MKKFDQKAEKIMIERFGKDTVIALATVENGIPHVRNVNAYYEDGSFYNGLRHPEMVLGWGIFGKRKTM